jgi:hypothetical protein
MKIEFDRKMDSNISATGPLKKPSQLRPGMLAKKCGRKSKERDIKRALT